MNLKNRQLFNTLCADLRTEIHFGAACIITVITYVLVSLVQSNKIEIFCVFDDNIYYY